MFGTSTPSARHIVSMASSVVVSNFMFGDTNGSILVSPMLIKTMGSHGTGGESSTAMDAATNEYAKKCKTPGPTPGEKRKKTPATGGIGCFAVKRRRIKSRRRRDKRPVSHFKDIKKGVGAQVETITRNIMLLD